MWVPGVTDASSDPTPVGPSDKDDDRRRRKAIIAAFVVAALVIAGAVAGFLLLRPDDPASTAAPVPPASTTVQTTVEPVDLTERTESAAASASTSPSSTPLSSTPPAAAEPILVGIAGPIDPTTGSMTGSIVSSPDGVTWSTDFTPSTTIRALAAGDGTVIAVGDTVAITSDGVKWTEVKGGPTTARGIAYGDGRWIAVGDPAQPPSARNTDNTFRFVTSTTTDGRSWQRKEHTAELPGGGRMSVSGIAFGNDGVGGLRSCRGGRQRRAGDGRQQGWRNLARSGRGQRVRPRWRRLLERRGLGAGRRPHRLLPEPGQRCPLASNSKDLDSWTTVDAKPAGALLDNLTCSGDRGWLAVGSDAPLTAVDRPANLYRSADLVSWTEVGRPEVGGLADVVAYRDNKTASAKVCGIAGRPAQAPAGTDPTDCAFELGKFGSGQAWLDVPDGATGCAQALKTWKQYESWTGPTEGLLLFASLPDGSRCSISNFPPSDIGRQLDDGSIGKCELTDGRTFVVWRGEAGQKLTQDGRDVSTAGAPGAPTTGQSTAGPAAGGAVTGGTVTGDLGLSVPMTRPACDGTGIVALFSAVNPAAYAAQVQQALDANPGAAYLRTDQSCASLTQATEAGDPIYAVYRVGGTGKPEVCGVVAAAGNGAYGKWLEDSGDAAARIDC